MCDKTYESFFRSYEQFSRKSTPNTLKKHAPLAPIGAAPEGAVRLSSPLNWLKALEKGFKHMCLSKRERRFFMVLNSRRKKEASSQLRVVYNANCLITSWLRRIAVAGRVHPYPSFKLGGLRTKSGNIHCQVV